MTKQFVTKDIQSHKSKKSHKIPVQTTYDIVKAHGGEIKVETRDGEGSEFIIQLPVT